MQHRPQPPTCRHPQPTLASLLAAIIWITIPTLAHPAAPGEPTAQTTSTISTTNTISNATPTTTATQSNPAPTPNPTAMPLVITNGDYRLTIHRVVTGVPARFTVNDKATVREGDFKTGELERAPQPNLAYTGIVYELEARTKPGEGGLLSALLSDGYKSVAARWNAWAAVKDADSTTHTTSFRGNRRGWGKVAYMDTPLNLPARPDPFRFDMYFTRKPDTATATVGAADDATVELKGIQIPQQGQHMDTITTTIQGIPLTIGLAGKLTDVPPRFSAGQFSGPTVYVSSPKPIPGIQLTVSDENGQVEKNAQWQSPTTDDLHSAIMAFGGNQEPKDPFQPGTPVTISVTLPETIHFQFNATPERPE